MEKRKRVLFFIQKYQGYLLLILLFVVASITIPYFSAFDNIMRMLRQSVMIGVLTLAMTIVFTTAEFDLSVGAIAGISGVVACTLMLKGYSTGTGILAALGIGGLIGVLNGYLVVSVGIGSFIATLGVSFLINAIELMISGGFPVETGLTPSYLWLGRGEIFGLIPVPIIFFLVIFGVFHFLSLYTTIGRFFDSIGGGWETSRLSGIRVVFYKWFAFILCGVVAAIGGLQITSQLSSAQVLNGNAFLMDAFTALFLGSSMFGEKPLFIASLIGAIFLTFISNALTLAGLNYNYIMVIKGGILLGVAGLSLYQYVRD